MRSFMCLCAILMALPLGANEPNDSAETPEAQAPSLKPILYRRTGGFAGTNDRIAVWPDGFVLAGGMLMPRTSGYLSGEQQRELAELFATWDELRPIYAMPGSDLFVVQINFGERTVTATDGAAPEPFRKIRQLLEKAVADLAEDAAANRSPDASRDRVDHDPEAP
jgi:hypothetical protein